MTPLKIQAASLVFLATTLRLVKGHGQVHSVITSSGPYQAADAYQAADPTSPLRKLNTYGPANFTDSEITCGVCRQSNAQLWRLKFFRCSRVEISR
jgi:lytic cellulose monooxygenase (C1-hydroxylating)